jgi:hypothetical protein
VNLYEKKNQKINLSFIKANHGGSLCARTLAHFNRNSQTKPMAIGKKRMQAKIITMVASVFKAILIKF